MVDGVGVASPFLYLSSRPVRHYHFRELSDKLDS
jgi:hypothetical protein